MKFYVGMPPFTYDKVTYWVVKGNRCEGDMVIKFKAPPEYTPSIAHCLILLDCKCQVEDNNYSHGRGRFKLLDAVKDVMAFQMGWEAVAEQIKQEAEGAAKKRQAQSGGGI